MSSTDGAILMASKRDGNAVEFLTVRDEPSVFAAGVAERSARGEHLLNKFGGKEEPLGDDGAMVGFA